MATPAPALPGIPPVEPEQAPAGVPTFGEKNRNLPEQLKNKLKECLKALQDREVYDRRIEVLRDRMHRFYDDGVQHFYPNYQQGTYQIGSPGRIVTVGDNTFECPDYLGAYNIFYPYRRSLDAVLTQNPPGIDFQPDNPTVSEDMEAAETAEGYRHYFDQANDIKQIQQQMSRLFCLSGKVVAWTRTVEDGQKWGENDASEPRKMERVDLYGTLEAKNPILARCQVESAYVLLYDDPDVLMAKQDYPWIRKHITGGSAGIGENEWERFARIGIQQARKGYMLTGNASRHIVTRLNAFLRPAVFEADIWDEDYAPKQDEDPDFDPSETNEDGEPISCRDKMSEYFPDGCHPCFVGHEYAEAENESLDDHIVIGFAKDRDGQTGGALMADMVIIQDEFNDEMNATREYYEKGWPSLWINAEDAEYDAFLKQQSRPAAIRQMKAQDPGKPLENNFYREPDMLESATFIQHKEMLRGPLGQFITGALPALQGETDPDSKTASGKAMDRAQAMGMLGMPWANMQRLFARIYYQAALCAAKNPDHAKDIAVVAGSGPTVSIRLEKLNKGKFHAHPDTDSSFPESTAAKRANMAQVSTAMASTPMGQIFFQSPQNWEQYLSLMGFPGMKLIPAEAYKKQVREIEILLKESPSQDEQATQEAMIQHAAATIAASTSGMPAPPEPQPVLKPSIPALPDDYHQWEAECCKEFLSSEECWRQLTVENNQDGVQNVRLHKAMHDMFLAQAAMAQAAMAPPVKPPAAPPGAKQVAKNSAPPGAPGVPTN